MLSYISAENICLSRIWRLFGHGSISKSFIHWLLRYGPAFLGWMSYPMLPYRWGLTYAPEADLTDIK